MLLHGLTARGVNNYYNWFQNADPAKPQTANAIIVKALENTLATLGESGMSWSVVSAHEL